MADMMKTVQAHVLLRVEESVDVLFALLIQISPNMIVFAHRTEIVNNSDKRRRL
jgi:hypothetical protein